MALKLGDKGEAVRCWERALSLTVTGEFDAIVDAVTRSFQTAHGLVADGIVGPKTWAARRGFAVVHSAALTHWGVRKVPPRTICLHHTDTWNREGMERTLQAKGFSTNGLYCQDGTIVEYGDPLTQVAWHAKVCNLIGLGADFEHRQGEPWPDVQLEAAARDLAWKCKIYDISTTINTARIWDGTKDHPLRTLGSKTVYPKARAGDHGITLHRQWAATICPGDLPVARLQALILEASRGW